MANFETGHAKNAALYSKVVLEAQGYGTGYNPSNPLLYITALESLKTSIEDLFLNLGDAEDLLALAVDERQLIFNKVIDTCPYIASQAIACGADEKTIEDIYQITRLIFGRRAVPIPKSEVNPTTETETEKAPESDPAPKVRRSASHASFDNRNQHFIKLVSLLEHIPSYSSNEAHLSVIGLKTLRDDTTASVKKVNIALTKVEEFRVLREKLLYHPKTGALQRVKMLKNYVKLLFGETSIQYKTLTALPFVNRRFRGII